MYRLCNLTVEHRPGSIWPYRIRWRGANGTLENAAGRTWFDALEVVRRRYGADALAAVMRETRES